MKRELEVFDRARSRFFLCAIQYWFLHAMNTAYLEKIDRSSPTFGALIAVEWHFQKFIDNRVRLFFSIGMGKTM